MNAEQAYIPIVCWKCNTQNNLAQSKVCRMCNCYLRPDGNTRQRDTFSNKTVGFGSFRGFIWVGIVLALVVGAINYFHQMAILGPVAKPGEVNRVQASLPPDSWYAKSWLSYIKRTPTVNQVLEKSEEATGKMLAPQIAKTLSISGEFSYAVGDCFTKSCMDDRQKQWEEQQRREDFAFDQYTGGRISRAPRGPAPMQTIVPKASDDWNNYAFRDMGAIEIATKLPAKFMKKASVTPPEGQYRKIEVLEVFNGSAGGKTTRYFDESGKPAKTENVAMDPGAAALAKIEMESLWKKNFKENSDQNVRGIEYLNEKVVFVITSKNKEGFEEVHYFDAVSGLPVKMDTKDFAVYFDNYKPYMAAKLPYTLHYRRAEAGGYHSWIQFDISEWKIGDYIDDSVFEQR